MAHIYHQQIDNIIKENKLYRFNQELADTDYTDESRKQLINEIILSLTSFKNTQQINEEKLQEHIKILKEEQYKKKWQFLNTDQRTNRLNEYYARNSIKDTVIIKKLSELLMSGGLTSKQIKYDHLRSIITEITLLQSGDNGVIQFIEPRVPKKTVNKKINNIDDVDTKKSSTKIIDSNTIKHDDKNDQMSVKTKKTSKTIKHHDEASQSDHDPVPIPVKTKKVTKTIKTAKHADE
jgi:hypothetical protein